MNIWNVVEELVRNPDKEFKTTDYYGSKGIEECCEYLFLGVLLYRLSEYCSSSEIRNIILDGDWFIE